jgi:hypothetical protein
MIFQWSLAACGDNNNPAYMLIRQKPITAAAPSRETKFYKHIIIIYLLHKRISC